MQLNHIDHETQAYNCGSSATDKFRSYNVKKGTVYLIVSNPASSAELPTKYNII